MNVLSLFDGMSCLQIALKRLGVEYATYYASEVDKSAIKATMAKNPNTIPLGDVREVKGSDLPEIWLMGGGSPCQSFSFAGKRKGMSTSCEQKITTLDQYLQLKEDKFEFEGQSYLFWEYMRLLKEIKPKYFLLENVSMAQEWEKVLTKAIGVNPIEINSSLVSAQNRVRLYWTNIGLEPSGLFGDLESTITQPIDKGILLRDILQPEVDEKYYISKKGVEGLIRASKRERRPQFLDVSTAKSFTVDTRVGAQTHFGQYVVCGAIRGRNPENPKSREAGLPTEQMLEINNSGKTNCLTTVSKDNVVVEGGDFRGDEGFRWRKNEKSPTLKSRFESGDVYNSGLVKITREVKQLDKENKESGGIQPYQQNRVYDEDGISPALMAQMSCKTHAVFTQERIRRFTPIEVCRLQTVPDDYFFDENGKPTISESQIYRCTGNGWTIDVICHILSFLKKELK